MPDPGDPAQRLDEPARSPLRRGTRVTVRATPTTLTAPSQMTFHEVVLFEGGMLMVEIDEQPTLVVRMADVPIAEVCSLAAYRLLLEELLGSMRRSMEEQFGKELGELMLDTKITPFRGATLRELISQAFGCTCKGGDPAAPGANLDRIYCPVHQAPNLFQDPLD